MFIDFIVNIIAANYFDMIIGLVFFAVIQFSLLLLTWYTLKGKEMRVKLITDSMLDSGTWPESKADVYFRSHSGLTVTYPAIGILVVTLLGWLLYLPY